MCCTELSSIFTGAVNWAYKNWLIDRLSLYRWVLTFCILGDWLIKFGLIHGCFELFGLQGCISGEWTKLLQQARQRSFGTLSFIFSKESQFRDLIPKWLIAGTVCNWLLQHFFCDQKLKFPLLFRPINQGWLPCTEGLNFASFLHARPLVNLS